MPGRPCRRSLCRAGSCVSRKVIPNAPTAPVPWGLMRRLWRRSARISRPCTGVTDRSRSFVSRLLPVQTTMPGWPGGAITGSSQPVSCGWRPCRISRRDRHPGFSLGFTDHPDPAWIESFTAGDRHGTAGRESLRAMLGALRPPARFATLSHEGSACGYGLAVIERGAAGLFDIQVAGTLRGRGLGRFLVAAILAQAPPMRGRKRLVAGSGCERGPLARCIAGSGSRLSTAMPIGSRPDSTCAGPG